MRAAHATNALAALAFAVSGQAQAEYVQQGLGASLSTEYDVNPALSPIDSTELWRLVLTPSYTMTRVSGPDALNARLGLRLERSSDTSVSTDRQDPSLSLDWTRKTAMDTFSVTGGYDKSSTRVSEFQDTGLLATDGSRVSRSLTATWRRDLDERDTLSLSAGYGDVSYQGGGLTDYGTLNLGGTLSRALSERVAPFVSLSASRYLPTGGGAKSHSEGISAGVNLKMSERLDLNVDAGINRTTGLTDNNSWQGGLRLNYAWDTRTGLALDLSRSASASGLGGYAEADQFKGSWSYALSEKANTGVDLFWRKNRTGAATSLSELGVWASRDLSPLWALHLSYRYRQRDESGSDGAQGHILALTLSYTHPDFSLSRM